MTPHVERPLPPYLQILQAIREQIDEHKLRPGDTVPSEREIASDWSVSRATATKVLAALRAEAPSLPCCFMTAWAGRYTPEDFDRAGAQRVIFKPFQVAQIVAILRGLAR